MATARLTPKKSRVAPTAATLSLLLLFARAAFGQGAPPPLLPPAPPSGPESERPAAPAAGPAPSTTATPPPRPAAAPAPAAPSAGAPAASSAPAAQGSSDPTPTPAPAAPSAPAPPATAAVAPPAAYRSSTPAPANAPRPYAELASLRLLREKGIITPQEYDSAVRDVSDSAGLRAPDAGTVVVGKWATTLYGFVEGDAIWDSTRSFNDSAGGAQVGRASTPAGDNARFTFGVRNSRIGLRLKTPEIAGGIRASAVLEMDFLGLPSGIAGVSEGAFLGSPVMRVRHLNIKVETPVVDFLLGQTWQLFGWQPAYGPNTVEIQGVPGQVYGRTPQLRVSKTVKAHPITFEIAVAATRPVQRDDGTPDGQGGIRFALDTWTGVQTLGPTGTQIAPLSVAATGLVRRVRVDQFAPAGGQKSTSDLTLSALAVDAFAPLLPGTKDKKDNSLSLNGEFATGYGMADMYTGFSGGIAFPALPPAMAGGTGAAFAANIDNGIVTYDPGGRLHGIEWASYLVGGQYYLPGVDGKVWLSGNYSHIESNNSDLYGTPKNVTKAEDWFDLNVFADPVPAVRVGVEYANFNTMYAEGTHAINHRVQFSGFFIF